MNNTTDIPESITVEEFYLATPLYTSCNLDDFGNNLKNILTHKTLDAFCVGCNENGTFINYSKRPSVITVIQDSWNVEITEQTQEEGDGGKVAITDYYLVHFYCARNEYHTQLHFLIRSSDNKITKIGQYPSLADLTYSEVNKYKKILNKEKFGEFKKAIGLASHGIGIGSFIYLRRVFVDLVEEAHILAKKGKSWDEDAYKDLRMAERIGILQNFLPDFLVENKVIFSILSKGVHDLNEDECMTYYNPMKVGIELMLDQKLKIIEEEKKIKSTSKEIAHIVVDLKKGKTRSQ